MTKVPPPSELNLWSDNALSDPFPSYRQLRDMAPVVHLKHHDLYAVTRYDGVKQVLADWQSFSSAQGVGFNEPINQIIAGSLVGSDPPQHRHYRSVLERPLSAADLRIVRDRVNELAVELVSQLVDRESIEVVSELASYLPVTLVAELVGLPTEGRERMLAWAAGAFNSLAPLGTPRVQEGMAIMGEMQEYFADASLGSRVREGSWAARLKDAVERGEIKPEEFSVLLSVNYVLPALDTTIHATGNMLWLLAQDKRWQTLRQQPGMVGRALHECLRLEGPVQAFSRMVTRDTEIDGYAVRAGQRLLVCFASANRDERHYAEPERFDLSRKPGDHFAFGYEEHVCLGRNLATLELSALLMALLKRVERLTVVEAKRGFNNGLRGFSELRIALH